MLVIYIDMYDQIAHASTIHDFEYLTPYQQNLESIFLMCLLNGRLDKNHDLDLDPIVNYLTPIFFTSNQWKRYNLY